MFLASSAYSASGSSYVFDSYRRLFGLSLLKLGIARWFGQRAWIEGGGRGVRPAAQWLSFASPKESHQRKGDPTRCV
ncbi:MAG: hypothetical protein KKH21_08815, partial [Gammaproteobacteria bacterium]|nr:hypothetical protein [Gammaproteobacteria bacterium]